MRYTNGSVRGVGAEGQGFGGQMRTEQPTDPGVRTQPTGNFTGHNCKGPELPSASTPILQISKSRLREVKALGQGLPASKQQSRGLAPGLSDFKA